MDDLFEKLREKAKSEKKTLGQLMREALKNAGADLSVEKCDSCSFCGKSQSEVKKLIAGPSVYICDQCVKLCMAIIKDM